MRSFTAIALTLALGALPALAQDRMPPPPPGTEHDSEHMEHRMAAMLHLTESQRASIKPIWVKHSEASKAMQKAMGEAWAAYKAAESKPDARLEDLKVLNRNIADLMFDMKMDRKARRKEIGALLTPEQREKAAFMLGRMSAMRHERGGEHRHEGGEWGHRHDGPGMDGDNGHH